MRVELEITEVEVKVIGIARVCHWRAPDGTIVLLYLGAAKCDRDKIDDALAAAARRPTEMPS